MPRDCDVYLSDIAAAIEKIQRYTAGLSIDALRQAIRSHSEAIRDSHRFLGFI